MLIRPITTSWAAVRWGVRRWLLNRHRGIDIAAGVRVAPTVQFQLEPDWYRVGGTIRIARGARISDGAILAPYGGAIVIHENSYVGPYCVLYGHGGLTIGPGTLIAAHTVIIPSNHSFDDPALPIIQQGETSLGITIGQDVWIGCGVRILDGVTIGDGCVIGAGAVVTRSLEPHSVAVGVPARPIAARGLKNRAELSEPVFGEKS